MAWDLEQHPFVRNVLLQAAMIKLLGYSQETQDIDPMLSCCWANIVDGGPAIKQHWVNDLCFLGLYFCAELYIITYLTLKLLKYFCINHDFFKLK